MSYRFELDPAHKVLLVTFSGQLGDELAKKSYKDISETVTRLSPGAVIVSLSEITSYEVSTQAIHEMAGFKPMVEDPSVPRIVVAPSAHIFGMLRMFQILGEQTRPMLQIVSSMDEAYAELGVTKLKFEPLAED